MEMNTFREIVEKEANSLRYVSDIIDEKQVLAVFYLLKNCKGKIITTGCGTSGVAAKKISHTLNVIGISSTFLSPADAPHGGVGMITEEDVVILISKGGETVEINQCVDLAKMRGAKIIGVTEKEVSYLAKNSDQILQVIVDQEADDFNMVATSSILAVISVFDVLAILLARENHFSKEQFLKVHPGGEVGDKLRKETGE
ncbi:KpsF/GutQ family sugar-phosphate isomerase [Tetragenococcus halophilus]|uniref:KpsF/GutQ family sugar-phosphate isomerase n=1 Tax=Tetragenococcus halophilus TaxID=51669 RepID=UPI000B92D248|nr:SIS domain-containing protein [Tetragenococcus halophilus]MCT8311443.1 SIS domain-containing protein [Tetragenococcus halophilus]